MGGIIVSEFVSIDGFYADPGGGLDWVTADDEHHDYSISLLERTGLLLFGRRTYEIFEAYWPHVADNRAATRRELAIGALLDRIPKVVYSRTRSYSGWVTTVRPQLAPAELVTAKAERRTATSSSSAAADWPKISLAPGWSTSTTCWCNPWHSAAARRCSSRAAEPIWSCAAVNRCAPA